MREFALAFITDVIPDNLFVLPLCTSSLRQMMLFDTGRVSVN